MQVGGDEGWREARRSRWQSSERGERRGRGEGVRHREEWRETEEDGRSCHESLTHAYCSGYRTEPRGTKLMYDSRRTITLLQTRISLICEREWNDFTLNGVLTAFVSSCDYLDLMNRCILSIFLQLCTDVALHLIPLAGHCRVSLPVTWNALTAPASLWFIFQHIPSAILSVVICS